MKIKITFLFCAVLWSSPFSWGQNLGIGFLFRPSVRVGAQAIPQQPVGDSLSFGVNRTFANFVIPLGGSAEVEVDLKRLKKLEIKKGLNAKVQQHFLTINSGLRQFQGNYAKPTRHAYNFGVGLTGIKASLRRGLWFYTTNLGIIQSTAQSEGFHPYFLGAGGIIFVKGLRKQTVLGAGLTYWRGGFLPFPLLGITRPLGKKFTMELLLPAQAQVRYKAHKKAELRAFVGLQSFAAGLGAAPPSWLNEAETGNYFLRFSEVRTSLIAEWKVKKRMAFFFEAGATTLAQLDLFREGESLHDEAYPIAPFLGVSMQMGLGRAPISTKVFGNDF